MIVGLSEQRCFEVMLTINFVCQRALCGVCENLSTPMITRFMIG